MSSLQPEGPNAEQIKFWNETRGGTWVAQHDAINAQIAPLGRLAMERASVAAGERVLDVGCGCGTTTIELARRVGPSGRVLGADISGPMLADARKRASAAGVPNVEFVQADAQTYTFPSAAFDLLFSRFGVMFFADPTAAFANLRTALRSGGRIAFVCWRTLPENPWMGVPLAAALQFLPPPPIPGPDAPGPFAFADRDRVERILAGAGFTDVAFDAVDEPLVVGGGADIPRTVEFLLQMGPLAAAMREAGQAKSDEVLAAVAESLRPYYTDEDGVRMPSASWIVTARV